jgi:hypothetical protein
MSGATVYDTTVHNANGLPDFHLSRFALPYLAAAQYLIDVQVSNRCGAVISAGHEVVINDTVLYNPSPIWNDTTRNWTEVPVPCCLDTLLLENVSITGDVQYHVRSRIVIRGGVTVTPNSDIVIQAGHVIQIDTVEFDGSNSSVEIIQVPCPNRMACGNCDDGVVSDMVMGGANPGLATDSRGFGISTERPLEAVPVEAKQASAENVAIKDLALWVSPNPVQRNNGGKLKVGFTLPEPEVCSLQIMDMQNRPVKVLLRDESLPLGDHVLEVDVSGLASGVYFVRLMAGERVLVEKVLVQ